MASFRLKFLSLISFPKVPRCSLKPKKKLSDNPIFLMEGSFNCLSLEKIWISSKGTGFLVAFSNEVCSYSSTNSKNRRKYYWPFIVLTSNNSQACSSPKVRTPSVSNLVNVHIEQCKKSYKCLFSGHLCVHVSQAT